MEAVPLTSGLPEGFDPKQQRGATYAATLHGGNVGLKALLEVNGDEYYRTNMRCALLECWSMRYRRRPCPAARVVLEGRAPCAIVGAQQD